jgi:hypothetical protein
MSKDAQTPDCNGTDLRFWKWSDVRMEKWKPRYPETLEKAQGIP